MMVFRLGYSTFLAYHYIHLRSMLQAWLSAAGKIAYAVGVVFRLGIGVLGKG